MSLLCHKYRYLLVRIRSFLARIRSDLTVSVKYRYLLHVKILKRNIAVPVAFKLRYRYKLSIALGILNVGTGSTAMQ